MYSSPAAGPSFVSTGIDVSVNKPRYRGDRIEILRFHVVNVDFDTECLIQCADQEIYVIGVKNSAADQLLLLCEINIASYFLKDLQDFSMLSILLLV